VFSPESARIITFAGTRGNIGGRPLSGGRPGGGREKSAFLFLGFILSAVEIVPIHTNRKRERGNDLATSLARRVSVSLNREQYGVAFVFARTSKFAWPPGRRASNPDYS